MRDIAINRRVVLAGGLSITGLAATGSALAGEQTGAFVRVCRTAPRYLELNDGRLYVPVGPNIAFPRHDLGEAAVARMSGWIERIAAGGGNYARMWLTHPAFDAETSPGVFDPAKVETVRGLLDVAEARGVKIKPCLHHIRHLRDSPPLFPGSVSFGRPSYSRDRGGPLATIDDLFATEAGRDLFLARLDAFAPLRDHPGVFGWELWNEIDTVEAAPEVLLDWTRWALEETRRVFPNHLVMQSLGSFDAPARRRVYGLYARLPGNDIAQVHRYLDPGAPFSIARGSVAGLAEDSVSALRAEVHDRPVLLTETGAVLARHAGPSDLYPSDPSGVMLHDALYAAYFAGAAGPGQFWHWDFYIERHDLWGQFGRFLAATEGFDPRVEHPTPVDLRLPNLAALALAGETQAMVWLRDQRSDWKTELVEGRAPEPVVGARVPLADIAQGEPTRLSAFDPWTGETLTLGVEDGQVVVPDFLRSTVVRVRWG